MKADAIPVSLEPAAQAAVATVAILEDDLDLVALLKATLGAAGFATTHFASVAAWRRDGAGAEYEALLVDLTLPDGSGLDVVRMVRAGPKPLLPVIVLTAMRAESDVVAGIEAGADDYVSKPARPAELVARMRGVLRRAQAANPAAAGAPDIAPYAVDETRGLILLDGAPVELTAREFDIARHLLHNVGRLVTRRTLEVEVCRISERIATRSIDTHISRIRRKLGFDGGHGLRLATVYQQGYRLVRA